MTNAEILSTTVRQNRTTLRDFTLCLARKEHLASWRFSSSHTCLTNRESRQAHINTHQKERKQQTNARCKLPRRLLQQIREEVQDLPCKQDCGLDSITVGYETVFVFPLPNTVWQVRFCDCWILPRRICEEKQNKTNKKTKKKFAFNCEGKCRVDPGPWLATPDPACNFRINKRQNNNLKEKKRKQNEKKKQKPEAIRILSCGGFCGS